MKSTRLFAVLLAALMILTLIPATVFAQSIGGGVAGGGVAETYYTITIENTAIEADKEGAKADDTVTLTVTPDEGFGLKSLTVTTKGEDGENVDVSKGEEAGTYTFTMPASSVTVSAEFAKVYKVTAEEAENGAIKADKEEAFPEDEVTITAEPEEDFIVATIDVFDSEENAIDVEAKSDNEFTFEMPEDDVTVTVTFKKLYKVTMPEETANGKAEADKTEVFPGDTVTITLTPDEGYVADKVSIVDAEDEKVTFSIKSNVYTFEMPKSDVTVSVSFKEKSDEPYSITINKSIKHGDVTVKKTSVKAGETVTLRVTPDSNYALDTITVTDEDDNEIETTTDEDRETNVYTFVMPESDVTVDAKFVETEKYDIKIIKPTHGSIKTDMSSAHEDEKVTITISANSGYTIKKVTVYYEDEEDDEVSVKVSGTGTTKRTFEMPAADVTIEAEFRSSDSGSDSSSKSSGSKSSGSSTTFKPTNNNNTSNNDTADTTPKAHPFNDVSDDDWFSDDVIFAYKNNLMKGVTEDTFSPSADTTRAMIVTILHRIEGEPAVYTVNPFTDVADDAWYANAIKWASAYGIVKGVSDTEFAPDAVITREQFAAILYRYAQYKVFDTKEEADISAFEDEADVQDWAVKPIKWAVAKGFINGITSTTLVPRGNASRAQAAAILHRIKNAIK